MNPYNLSVLFFSFCNFLIGLLILLKRNDEIGKRYFIFSLAVTTWSFFFSLLINQNVSYQTALLSSRLCNVSAVFIPAVWLHVVLALTNRIKNYKKLLLCLYSLSILIDLFSFTPLFIPKVGPAVGFIHYTRPGPIFHIFVLMFFAIVPFTFRELFLKICKTRGEEQLQLKGFFVATFLGFLGGSLTFLPVYNIMFPQHTLFLLPIYPFMMAYFMIRHKLFDVEEIVQVFQREKLATIGLLAASVNHEIRNPLYVAKSNLESYIESEQERESDHRSIENSKKSLAAINRALEVITKLNRSAKPSDVSINCNRQASIPEALQTVLDLVSYEFQLDKIKIINQIDPNLPSIQADQRQLEEILFNLIVNACHAMENGGELTITASCHSEAEGRRISEPRSFASLRMTKTGSQTTDKIRIIIQDTGSGISQDQMKHLFEPFHTTKGDKGTGLGLYITKQLVERNGGKISVSSKPDQGTSFKLEFKILQN